MKTRLLCTIAMAVLFVAVGIAQEELIDVVYLKDGSVIRGTIIEQIPNKSLKIETRDGSIIAVEFSRVEKIVKERAISPSRTGRSSSSSGTHMVSSLLIGGLLYEDFWFATGAKIGVSIAGMAYVGLEATAVFSDETAVYFGGDLGLNVNIGRFTVQPYVSLGLGSIAGASAFCLGPGVSFTYWITKDVGIGPDGKYMFVPDIEDNFGLIHLSISYRF